MAVEVASAYVTLMPSMKGFQKRMEKEFRGMDLGTSAGDRAGAKFTGGFTKKASAGLGKWAKRGLVAVGAAAGAALGTALVGGMNRMLNIEDAENKLKGLGHSAESVTKIMEDALASVKGTAFGLDDAATNAATAVAAGVKPGEELTKYLSLVGDAATIAGVGLGEMGSIFGKVQTNQRAYTQELNQLADRGIPIYQWLQEEYGVTAEELRKMVSDGKVDAETYFRVIDENIGGAALNAGDTTRGSLANMRAAWSRFGAALLKDVFPLFKDGIGRATEFADYLTSNVGTVIEWLSERLAPVAANVGEAFTQGFDWAKTAAQGLYDVLINGDFSTAFRDAFGVEEDSAVVTFLFNLRDAAIEVAGWVQDSLVPALGDLAGALGSALLDSFDWLVEKFVALSDWYDSNKETIGELAAQLGEALTEALELAGDAFATLTEKAREVIDWMLDHPGIVATVVGAYYGLRGAVLAYDAAQKVAAAGGMVKFLTDTFNKLKIVTAAKKVWTAVTWLAHGAMKALNWVMKMNHIGLIITGIMLLVGAFIYLWKNNEAFREFWLNLWDKIKTAVSHAWENWIKPAFEAIRSFVMETLVPAFVSFYEDTIVPVWDGIVGALKKAWGWIEPIFKSVGGFVVDILVVYFRLLMKVVEIVWKTIFAVIKVAWENGIKPAFHAIWEFIKDSLVPTFEAFMLTARAVWDAVKDKITAVWRDYVQPVLEAIWTWIKDTIVPIFESLWAKVRDVWDSMKQKIKDVWEQHISKVFDALSAGVEAVKEAFGAAVDGVKTAWDKIRQIVAKPIVAVINFVNDGIIDSLNSVLEWADVTKIRRIAIPADLRNAANGWFTSPNAGRTFGNTGAVMAANGGILPGYSPGKDDHFFIGDKFNLALAGGEAIMRPEWTRAVGKDFVDSMNYAARTGGVNGVKAAMGFANGGIIDHIKGIPGNVADFLAGPTSYLRDKFMSGLDALRDNPFFAMAEAAVKKLVGAAKDKVFELLGIGGFDGNATVAGGVNYGGPFGWAPGGGMAWQQIWAMVKMLAPEASLTSAQRGAGSLTASGVPSLHGLGRAIDIVSPNMAATFMKLWPFFAPIASQFFYTPMGNLQRGYRDAIIANTHKDHIHIGVNSGGLIPKLYDEGGWLQPGVSLVSNKTQKPEAILTEEQLNNIGGDTHITLYGVPMDIASETADELLFAMRRTGRGKYNRAR